MAGPLYTIINYRNELKNAPDGSSLEEQTFRQHFLKRFEPNAQKEDFYFKEIIGSGNFGNVFLAYHQYDMNEYAVKVMDKETLVKTGNVENAYREKQVIANLSNPFVISCKYYFMDSCHVYLATPYVSGGDMYHYIMWSGRLPNEDVARFYAAQIVLALEYLHKLQIIHRDLKPENLMLDERGFVKLIDFGYCSVFKGLNYTICGTRQYMAPEMLAGNGYGKSVDYWSLGVLIHELNCFELPFDDEDPASLAKAIKAGKYNVKRHFSRNLKDLLAHLLDVDPLTRYGCREDGAYPIKGHPWFGPIDFMRLYKKDVVPPLIPDRRSYPAKRFERFLMDSKDNKYFEEFDNF